MTEKEEMVDALVDFVTRTAKNKEATDAQLVAMASVASTLINY